jgi:hypothetical protein
MLLYAYPSAYAHLFMLMVSYVCLCLLIFAACLCTSVYAYGSLCMLMYVICLLMGYDISEGMFYWTMK